MSFTKIDLIKDPFIFGNAMVEYKDGRPIGAVPLAQPTYKSSYGDLTASNENKDVVVLELEDEA